MYAVKKYGIGLTFIFMLLISIVYGTFITIHQSFIPVVYYGIFSILLIHLNANRKTALKKTQLAVSLLLIVAGGFLFPADIEQIEEMYLFIPLIYLFILPGTFWPILVGVLILSAYLPSFENTELFDFVEDSLELLFIIAFATIMTYFQQKSLKQMKTFEKESNTDFLTRLPNRKQFTSDMKKFEERCKSGSMEQFSLAIIDLDGFKKVNDQFGHSQGDTVLCLVAERLKSLETEYAKPYRLGGDEFAFLVEESAGVEIVKELTQKVIDFVKKPYVLDVPHFISSSIGVSSYPKDTEKIELLYSNADLAMYKSKNSGKNGVFFYDNSVMKKTIRKYEIEDALKGAVDNNELIIHYQPKVHLETDEVHSSEALIRWNHPKLGRVDPNEFIPIAEETGLIIPLGEWVLEKVCRQIVQWRKHSYIKTVAVNVSPVQLSDPDFINSVAKILQKTGCRGEWLEIEQTETWVMQNPSVNIDILNKLKTLGITLSLDDFGTAYSSLSQIRRLPLDVIKIDKSFIDHCIHNTQDHMLVRTIIQLGHNLGMTIIAEGVETVDQRELLHNEKCDYYQGFLFSKPIESSKIEKIFRRLNSLPNGSSENQDSYSIENKSLEDDLVVGQ